MTDDEPPTHELTADEAVSLAIRLLRDGGLAEAEALLGRVLAAVPDHPRALHYAGVLAHQRGHDADAIRLIERSLALVTDEADWRSNLGMVLQADGQIDAAMRAYRRALAADPAHANAHSNLGVLLRATGHPSEAEAAYRTAIRLNPSHVDAYTNLGILLNGLGRTQEAAACFSRVITLRPRYREARRLLALAHCTLGEVDRATAILEEWLRDDASDPIARHMLAACTRRDVPARASEAFVAATFDGFAASFEAKLARLSYRAPALVGTMLEQSGLAPAKALDVLDAGCGTGLCGAIVAPYARRLVGVDLSEGMLAHARRKGVYDELVRAELTGYLRAHRGAFDLVVSADTFVYFGDLREVLLAVADALRPNGRVGFSVEHAVGAAQGIDYRLEYHGRYSHSRPYVERLLGAVRMRVECAEAELRMESGAPVPGLVVVATKAEDTEDGMRA